MVKRMTVLTDGGFGMVYRADYCVDSTTGETREVILKYVQHEKYRNYESELLSKLTNGNSLYTAKLIKEW